MRSEKSRRPPSIRRRIILLTLLGTSASILLFCVFIYRNMSDRVNARIQEVYLQTLKTAGAQLDKAIDEMHKLSSGLSYDGGAMERVEAYLHSKDMLTAQNIRTPIERQLMLNDFSSPVIGFTAFFEPDNRNRVILSSDYMARIDTAGFERFFFRVPNTEFQRPHPSITKRDAGLPVLSLLRVTPRGGGRIGVYVESDPTFLTQTLAPLTEAENGESPLVALADAAGALVFASPEITERSLPALTASETARRYSQISYAAAHWQLLMLIPKSRYSAIYFSVLGEFSVLIAVYVLSYVLLAVLIIRAAYRPLASFVREMSQMDVSAVYMAPKRSVELDMFAEKIDEMRAQIRRLLTQVEQEAKRNTLLENQLLLSRINPHFLHNTLNSIRLQADETGQKKLADMLSAINNLLHYNLQKSRVVTLRDELRAVEHYCTLQRSIFEFTFENRVSVPGEALDIKVPSFILQPIVENCFKHCGTRSLDILLEVTRSDRSVLVCVSDNGNGMVAEKLEKLNEHFGANASNFMGIGLGYVSSSLKMMFGADAEMRISENPAGGVRVALTFPMTE